jgi:hypothetical protein
MAKQQTKYEAMTLVLNIVCKLASENMEKFIFHYGNFVRGGKNGNENFVSAKLLILAN